MRVGDTLQSERDIDLSPVVTVVVRSMCVSEYTYIRRVEHKRYIHMAKIV